MAIDPDINSTRVQSWNVTVERQLGESWGVAASYLGTYLDRIWGQDALNPGIYMGTAPCTLRGVFYPVCSTQANTDARRVFSQVSAEAAQMLSYVSQYRAIGTQAYRGLKLSFQNRGIRGVTVTGNYTVSRSTTNTPVTGGFMQANNTWLKPGDPSYGQGNCPYNQTHIANPNAGWESPESGNSVLRAIASRWRVSGILNANSGNWLTVTTSRDIAFSGIPGQRVNQVLDDPYTAKRSLERFLNPAAFAYPANGILGDHAPRSIEGPGFWKVDLSLARLLSAGGARTLELRIEAFNVFDNFNGAIRTPTSTRVPSAASAPSEAIPASCSSRSSTRSEAGESAETRTRRDRRGRRWSRAKDRLCVLTLEGPATAGGATTYVIAIGVNQYAHPSLNLRYAVADAEAS